MSMDRYVIERDIVTRNWDIRSKEEGKIIGLGMSDKPPYEIIKFLQVTIPDSILFEMGKKGFLNMYVTSP